MSDERIKSFKVIKRKEGETSTLEDYLLVERPLSIRIDGESFVTSMCTPGDELELAAGLMLAEGVIDSKKDIAVINFCRDEQDVVEVRISPARSEIAKKRMQAAKGISRSSCGICGRELIDELSACTTPLDDDLKISSSVFLRLDDTLRDEHQKLFGKTGAAHSAGIFDAAGKIIAFAEDIGRHNALDKAIGKIVLRFPDSQPKIAMLSSRASFEMLQKIARAKIPVACFASAPSSMAVEVALRQGITLVGFLRGGNFNVYANERRIKFD